MSAIEFENVAFSYDGAHRALDGITLSIEQGSFVCVLGSNGSGKSTLAKHINALLVPDSGSVHVLGRDTADPGNVFFVRSNAGMVFQNPDDQIVASIVENDVAFGPENLGVPTAELRARVDTALARVGLEALAKKPTEALSGGQKQRVAVAGVLAMQPQIIVLDEASAMLDPRGRRDLTNVCRELNDDGLTVVLITHFMEEAALADRIIVLEDGRIALDGAPDEVLVQAKRLAELSLEMPFATQLSMKLRDAGMPVALHADEEGLEAELAKLLARNLLPQDAPPAPHQDSLGTVPKLSIIEFDGVSFAYGSNAQWALEDITFDVKEGEFFGIAGHTGSGKSTLIQLANGLLAPNSGTVRVEGRDLSDKRAAAQARRSVGLVFQYPEHQLFASTVFDDVAFGPRNLGYSAEQVEANVRAAMELVHLDFDELRDRSPFELSGGQQRRVAFAGVLAMQPHALVLDEPTAGLDPRTRRSFLDLLAELHDKQGLAIVVVSHDMDDLANLCERILVLNEGRLFALGEPSRIFADEQALVDIGLGVPRTTHVANRLKADGVVLPISATPSIDDLSAALSGAR